VIIDEETYLEHWGVKGMRWGVRNKRPTSESEEKPTSSESREEDDDDFDDEDLYDFMRRERYKKAAVFVGSMVAGAAASIAISKVLSKNAAAGQVFTAAKSINAAVSPTLSEIGKYRIPQGNVGAGRMYDPSLWKR
jgi:hypothetical protein